METSLEITRLLQLKGLNNINFLKSKSLLIITLLISSVLACWCKMIICNQNLLTYRTTQLINNQSFEALYTKRIA